MFKSILSKNQFDLTVSKSERFLLSLLNSVSLFHPSPSAMLTWIEKKWFEYHLLTENTVKRLLREGFIENIRKHRESNKDFWVLTLRHRRNRKGPYKTILNLKRISRPGLRIYSNYQQIPRLLGGMGIVILSPSRGIMTDRPRSSTTGNRRRHFVFHYIIIN